MVVCICNAIREHDLRQAVRAGASSPCEAYRAIGRKPKCGQCIGYAREIIDSERAAA